MAYRLNFFSKNHGSKSSQKGVVLVLFAFVLGLVVTSLGIKFLSGGSLQIQSDVYSIKALSEAKAAVIGNVISSMGKFPCSEDVTLIGLATEGQASGGCSNAAVSVGRFAWRTLGTGELRDGSGAKPWYALSVGFRTVPVNSDTVGQLSIDGVQNQAIALLFSPGRPLSGQSRPIPTSSSAPVVADYLEAENSDGDRDFSTGLSSATFNDQLLAIKADDVFPTLEKRVLGEFKNYLNAYKAIWGAFPFPAQFGNPTLANYIGDAALSGGFLPISNVSPATKWSTAITPKPVVVSPAGNIVSAPSCSFRTGNTRIRCDITISAYNSASPPSFSILGSVNSIGFGFYDGLSATSTNDIQITTRSGSATVVNASRLFVHSLNAAGNATVTFSGILANTGVVRIEFRRTPPLSNWVLAATNHTLLGGNAGNNWHHLTYYKVAAPFLPGGGGVCSSNCLTVNAINVTPNTSLTDKHVLLMSAGRKLDVTDVRLAPTYGVFNPAQARSGSSLADYFDSSNNISGGLVFDSTNLPLATFNDQVKIVE